MRLRLPHGHQQALWPYAQNGPGSGWGETGALFPVLSALVIQPGWVPTGRPPVIIIEGGSL
jgi:hypothetical protein